MENYIKSSTAVEPSQTPVVAIELQRLEKQLEELAHASAALEGRLAFIMREPMLEPESNALKNPVAAQSELSQKLRDRNSEVERIIYRLSTIMRRLEI